MNVVIILGGIYALIDYYYDDSPVKKWKLAIATFTIPTIFITFIKLLKMKILCINYILVNTINYLTMDYYKNFYIMNSRLLCNFANDIKVEEFKKFNKDFHSSDYCYKDGIINTYIFYKTLKFSCIFKNLKWDYLEGENKSKKIYCLVKIMILNLFYYCSDGLLILKETDKCCILSEYNKKINEDKYSPNNDKNMNIYEDILVKINNHKKKWDKSSVSNIISDILSIYIMENKNDKNMIKLIIGEFEILDENIRYVLPNENKFKFYDIEDYPYYTITDFFYPIFHDINEIEEERRFKNKFSVVLNEYDCHDSYLVKMKDNKEYYLKCIKQEYINLEKHYIICKLKTIYRSNIMFGDFLLG